MSGQLSALLVVTAARWLGTARVPRAFARAGWRVAMLAPAGTLALAARDLPRWHELPARANPAQWAHACADAIEAERPSLIVPCDDSAFDLLTMLSAATPRGLDGDRHERIAAAIRQSLGDPDGFRPSVDKLALPFAAAAFGVFTPPSAVVASPAEAFAFGEDRGWPIVLKQSKGYGGIGVARVDSREHLAGAWNRLSRPTLSNPVPEREVRLLAQQLVRGHSWYAVAATWRGRWLAGWAARKVVAHPAPTGPSTVTEHAHRSDIEESARRLVAGFGMSGVFGIEFLVDDHDDTPWLLEINRRITPGVHKGAMLGVDVIGALGAAIRDEPWSQPIRLADDCRGVVVNFPQEWLRDPESDWLLNSPVDVPWDDPSLFAAMLRLRHRTTT